MDTAKYNIKKFLSFENLEQLIIPELQRDYVWEQEHVLDLLTTFHSGFIGNEQDRPYLGFVYAYNDKDHVYKYFVVDGQQRLTSIYIILILCYQLSNKPIPAYLNNLGKLKLDYKVRQSTHDFLNALVNHCQLNLTDYDFIIENQLWHHSNYENDRTIINLINNFYTIRKWLKEMLLDDIVDFTKYLESKVQLSYFDIENGREGEELYIYMNSRGKQLEINETLKAKFLERVNDDKSKLVWGHKWEEWQDFFWKNKGENPDADAGFDEFLRRVQILHMCSIGKSNEQISNFSSERNILKISTELLPKNLEELEKYFVAFKTIAESSVLSKFYNKYESSNKYFYETPEAKKRQIYYFITLPILALVKESKVADELTIYRFARFFYNISRKSNIGKDIASQLPSAIKLVQEYVSSKPMTFDVVGLINFNRNRTLLLDEEEMFKLKIFQSPPLDSKREEIEELFWEAEDHPIFKGEIRFLLLNDNEKPEYEFDIERIKRHWKAFQLLFPADKHRSNNALIIRALLFYGNTWIQDSPYYYRNYDCADWYLIVRTQSGKYLKALLNDMYDKPLSYLDKIIKKRIFQYFMEKGLFTIDSIKATESFLDQVKVLTAIDYFSNKVLWANSNFYFAEDDRFILDRSFFNRNRLLFNIQRYHYNDSTKLVYRLMIDILPYDSKIQQIINVISNYSNTD